ncbi:hypothetical protein I553_2601 [Mycobacterium xenopi 4042]|uniref:Uncharacterized protein n=1 Tax=Mycobacterium xenopi 4042 TaxID=1299334 RepID=X8C8J8_MYCXE|nr:hypothetical protein I553_2601 [Mycobacterium xenopi 4042]
MPFDSRAARSGNRALSSWRVRPAPLSGRWPAEQVAAVTIDRPMAGKGVEQRVRRIAEAALGEQRFVSALDVLLGSAGSHRRTSTGGVRVAWSRWSRRCRLIQTRSPRRWPCCGVGRKNGVAASETDYVARTRDRRQLRFSIDGDSDVEVAYRTHWVSPGLSQRAVERQSRAPDLVVIWPLKEWTCTSCGGTGDFLIMEDADRCVWTAPTSVIWSSCRPVMPR